jgi:hypothetical protein
MVSLACNADDNSIAALFPGALSVFGYGQGYQQVTGIVAGRGYWLNLPEPAALDVQGAVPGLTWDLPAGWSMVGPSSVSLDMSALRGAYATVVSVFGFTGGYQAAATMDPGHGYWINLQSSSQVDPGCCEAVASRLLARGPDHGGDSGVDESVLWVESHGCRQEMQLGTEPDQVVELPPHPPAGIFDARVEVQGRWTHQVPNSAGPAAYRVLLHGNDVLVGWQVTPTQSGMWELDLGSASILLDGTGTYRLPSGLAPAAASLRQVGTLPTDYALQQNHPNPFNPSTAITYQLPSAQGVELSIWNLAGQRVRQLVHTQQARGRYTVVWDGTDDDGRPVATGMYLCEVRAGAFRSVRKMVLLK